MLAPPDPQSPPQGPCRRRGVGYKVVSFPLPSFCGKLPTLRFLSGPLRFPPGRHPGKATALVGNASSGGTPASVGHSYAFGNTEEKARRLNMGCKARGQPGQPFSHKTGHGYVKAHRGFYHDAIFVKRNNFNLLLHETFGGGFSPTAVLKLRRLARKVARGSVDRTAYSPKYSLSFMSHHAERISLSVVRGVNRAIRSHLATLSARLARA